MLVVETIAKIRRAYFVQDKSIKQICRELRVSRNTVRKVIRSDATEFSYDRTVQPRPQIDPWRTDLARIIHRVEGVSWSGSPWTRPCKPRPWLTPPTATCCSAPSNGSTGWPGAMASSCASPSSGWPPGHGGKPPRLMHTRGHKQGMRWVRKMKTWLGRLIRDIRRKIEGNPDLEAAFKIALERAEKILGQQPGDKDKLYAFHAPEVECIGKGKVRTRYEFGVKTSIATTNERCKGGQFVLGAMALPGNPYDEHTLANQIDQVAKLTGVDVRRAYADRGYRGHGIDRDGLNVTLSHTREITSPTIRREMRRRNGIEPVIGHLKDDGHLERNHLAGANGDAINAILRAAGHNLRLLARWLRIFLIRSLAWTLFAGSRHTPAI